MRQRIVLFRFRKRGALPPSPLGRLPRSISKPEKRTRASGLTTFASFLGGSGSSWILIAKARFDAFSQQVQAQQGAA
jgi:hypothetical protein